MDNFPSIGDWFMVAITTVGVIGGPIEFICLILWELAQ